MVSAVAFIALSAAFIAVELFPFLDLQSVPDISTSTPASMLDGAVQIVLLLALFAGVAFVHRRLHPAAAGAGTELAALIMCTAVSLLNFALFVQPAGDAVALVADALPAVATGTFVLGITLVIAHIRAGGEGGGGAVDAGNGPISMPVEPLKKMALAATTVLVIQMAIVVTLHANFAK